MLRKRKKERGKSEGCCRMVVDEWATVEWTPPPKVKGMIWKEERAQAQRHKQAHSPRMISPHSTRCNKSREHSQLTSLSLMMMAALSSLNVPSSWIRYATLCFVPSKQTLHYPYIQPEHSSPPRTLEFPPPSTRITINRRIAFIILLTSSLLLFQTPKMTSHLSNLTH